ncbi:ABC transporter ATP-binding protein [Clostridium ljungdahlii]|uniref:Predicted iron ABC transporter, ATPase component n=2 Tax=Clostridium ljungdahlii TaxID=1538 RepID=D8GU16_CLOLD|nr:ABC transporter ATP-binding protein [Clostridium ljungdahlii]ADK16829.1 predicted iron ABC transporter, ATPase component [Clostridium ljungdahlii DSM 13528]OAA85630.1 putative siderophore transport system ATP-binding protein YusV [Clostridium ljungdahlii DSM 13528]
MILSVKGLTFKYPSRSVLKDINFSVKKGECLVILGTNGAGKSTLLKCINHILKAQSGTVLIEGDEIFKLSPMKLAQRIGYVSQQQISVRTTVFDSVLLGRKPYIKWNISKEDIEIVNKAVKALGLEDYSLRYLDELSGGELQKVVIARALAQKPEVLLLDEPTSNLDLKNQLEVIRIIREIVKTQQIAAVMIVHDLNLAIRFADKFVLLKDGSIFAAGGREVMTPENIESVYSVSVAIEKYRNTPVVVPL